MVAQPTFLSIVACVFFLLSAALFVLWQFRGAILARILPEEDIEFGPSWQDGLRPSDYASATINTAAPAHIISKLPVFVYSARQGLLEQLCVATAEEQGTDQVHKEGVFRVSDRQTSNNSSNSSKGGEQTAQSVSLPLDHIPSWQHKGYPGSQPIQQQQQDVRVELTLGRDQNHCSIPLEPLDSNRQPSSSASLVLKQTQQLRQQQQLETNHEVSSGSSNESLPHPVAATSSSSSSSSGSSADASADSRDVATGSSCSCAGQDGERSCVICFGDYSEGDLVKQLPCQHCYHAGCIDMWLKRCATCPLCKQAVWRPPAPFFIPC